MLHLNFKTIPLTFPNIGEEEKPDKFIEGLNYNRNFELLKSSTNFFENAAHVALRADSAIWTAKIEEQYGYL